MSSGLRENVNFGNQQLISKFVQRTLSENHSLLFDSRVSIQLEKQWRERWRPAVPRVEAPGVGKGPEDRRWHPLSRNSSGLVCRAAAW